MPEYQAPPYPAFGVKRTLFTLIGANMNVTTDQAFTQAFGFTQYSIDEIQVTNASASLTLAAGGIYTTTAKGGSAIVAAAQVYSALTAATKILKPTIASAGTDMLTALTLYLSLTVAQGGAATADMRIMGTAWA